MLLSAYIVPHPPILVKEIGKGEEERIAKTRSAYQRIAKEIKEQRPDTLIVFSPHAPSYYDYISISSGESAYGDFEAFRAPRIEFHETYDVNLASQVAQEAHKAGIPAGLKGDNPSILDHGTMVPLYFIEQEYTQFQLVRIAVSGLDRVVQQKFGRCIANVLKQNQSRVIVIASGDLSHKLKDDGPYGFTKEGPIFDEELISIIKRNDYDALMQMDEIITEKSAQCGFPSLLMLSGVLSGYAYRSSFLSYENTFGVGYGIAAIHVEQDPYVALAKMALEQYVRTRTILDSSRISKELQEPAAVFVSLKKNGQLRGCIGTIQPTKTCVGEELIANAIAAGTRDIRFPSVQKEELHLLTYSVDVLSEPEDIDSMDQLDPKRYGVIVGDGHHRGLLLPDLEGVNSVEEQVGIALRKAGMDGDEPFYLQRFEVIRHHEM